MRISGWFDPAGLEADLPGVGVAFHSSGQFDLARERRWWGGATAKAGPANGQAIPTVTPDELGYSVTHWTVEDGLPERIITSLAQTPDGYLWCGSPSGLARYDGARFTVFYPDEVPALKGVQVLELCCDAKGRLWIAGTKGQLVVYEHGRFRRLGEADGLSPDQAYSLNGVCEGELWLKSRFTNSFYRYHDGRLEAVSLAGIPSSTLQSFQADVAGVRWGVQSEPRIMVHFTSTGAEAQPLIAPDGKSPVWAGRLFTLQDGRLGLTSSQGIYVLKGGQWTLRRRFSVPIGGRGILDGIEDWHRNFWVSVFVKGLAVSTPEGRTAWVTLPDSNDRVHIRDLLRGAEGNIWAAGDEGLYRLRRNAFRTQPTGVEETHNKPAKTCLQDSKGRKCGLLSEWLGPRDRDRLEIYGA